MRRASSGDDEHGDDRRAHGRQHPQAGPQRRQSLDQLEVLGQEQHQRAGQHRADEHRAERHREVAVGEQPHVEQRVLEAALAADEVRTGEGADHDGRDRHRLPAGAGQLFQAVHDGQDRGERAEHADRVETARGWRFVFGQERTAEGQEEHHRRHAEQQDRAPPEVREQHSADDRSDHRTAHEAGEPDADGCAPLPGIAEHGADQRQGGGRDGRTGDSESTAGDDQHRRRCRVGRDDRCDAEPGRPDHQQSTSTDAVAERTHRDHEAGQHEAVHVHDPELLRAAGVQRLADARQREQHDEDVYRDQQRRQRQHGEADPLAAGRPVRSCSRPRWSRWSWCFLPFAYPSGGCLRGWVGAPRSFST